jgi:hypothetical protein
MRGGGRIPGTSWSRNKRCNIGWFCFFSSISILENITQIEHKIPILNIAFFKG